MPIPLARAVVGFLILAVALSASPALALTDEEVERKITDLKNLLYTRQDKQTGGWFDDQYHPHPSKGNQDPKANRNLGGPTAIATLALLLSGESFQDPRVAKGIDYLRSIDMYGTYALSLKVHVWSYLPDQYLDFLEKDTQTLLNGADANSRWHYVCFPKRDGGWDNSTNQYGILGTWQYTKRGGRVPSQFWENAAKHFFETQNPDGGWSYAKDSDEHRKSKQTMTCAGLTCLYIVQQELFRDQNKPPANLAESINRGLGYLDQKFSSGGDGAYGRYGYERVALASGVKYFKGQDWYDSLGGTIVRTNHGGDKNVAAASFDLMFLSRGRIPVWINKVQLSKGNWNNRPNDLYFLSRYLSHFNQKEVNWQVIQLDHPVLEYLNAPVTWLSTDSAITLSEKEKANLKQYLDLGGTLMVNNESSSQVEASILKLGSELYPNYEWRQLDGTHSIANLIVSVDDARGNLPIKALGNGARDLIYFSARDWGLTLQKDNDLSKPAAGQYMTNLYAMVSDRGNLPNRLDKPFPPRAKQGGSPVWIAQATFGPDNKLGNPEPEAFVPLANILADAGIDLKWAPMPLDQVSSGKINNNTIKLVHLAGVDPVELTPSQKEAIKAYADSGGTIFVETVGGRGEFAVDIERQLREVFGEAANKLSRVEPIVSGAGLKNGKPIARAVFRKFSVINMAAGNQHRLRAISINNRPAVIFSSEDLSLGALGVRHWGINGYAPDTAHQIVSNIIMAAAK